MRLVVEFNSWWKWVISNKYGEKDGDWCTKEVMGGLGMGLKLRFESIDGVGRDLLKLNFLIHLDLPL